MAFVNSSGFSLRAYLRALTPLGKLWPFSAGWLVQSTQNWLPMNCTFGATWERSSLPGLPLDVRVTTPDQTVVATRALAQSATGDNPTSVQMQPSPSLPSAPASDLGAQTNGTGPTTNVSSPATSPTTPPGIQPAPPAAKPALLTLPPLLAPVLDTTFGQLSSTSTLQQLGLAPALEPAASPVQPSAIAAPLQSSSPSPSPPAPAGLLITPAPAVFSVTQGLTTLTPQAPAVGPASGEAVAAASGTTSSNCLTLAEVLGELPDASQFLQLMQVRHATAARRPQHAAPKSVLLVAEPIRWRPTRLGAVRRLRGGQTHLQL